MLARCVATLKPPPELTLSQWADRYRMLSAESSAEPGRWHTDKAPYQREIMDAIGDAHIRRVVIMCAAQLGKTELLLNILGYFMAYWEAGAKQNFDTGLYTAHTILYIRVEDYGPKPKIGKRLVLDKGTKSQRTYTINLCQEESGVYRMTMERTRQ